MHDLGFLDARILLYKSSNFGTNLELYARLHHILKKVDRAVALGAMTTHIYDEMVYITAETHTTNKCRFPSGQEVLKAEAP